MTKSRRITIAGVTVLAAIIALAAATRYQRRVAESLASAHVEKATLQFFKDPKLVPDFSLQTLDGQTISSRDLRGKVTLVNFWATWCAPCRAEIPDLIALQNKYPDQLQIIGISEDHAPDPVRRFVTEYEINYPVAMSTPELQRAFRGVTGLPTTFVLDHQARIVQRHVGLLNAKRTELEARALAGLSIDAAIEQVEPEQPVGLANAAQAKEIPGIDLARLSPEKRVATLQRLNAEPCTCGCGLTVAKCRIDDPDCPVSLPLARTLADEIAASP